MSLGTTVRNAYIHFVVYVCMCGAGLGTYFSVVKVRFTLRASARTVAPEFPISFSPRLWKRVLQN